MFIGVLYNVQLDADGSGEVLHQTDLFVSEGTTFIPNERAVARWR
jgi:hypothetical protein